MRTGGGPIVVRGTTVMEGQPERSFAMIENKNTGHTGPYSIVKGKNVVVAKAVLVEIRELEVLIKYEGVIQRCGAAGHTFTAPEDDASKPKSATVAPIMNEANLNSIKGILEQMAAQMKREKGGKRDPAAGTVHHGRSGKIDKAARRQPTQTVSKHTTPGPMAE